MLDGSTRSDSGSLRWLNPTERTERYRRVALIAPLGVGSDMEFCPGRIEVFCARRINAMAEKSGLIESVGKLNGMRHSDECFPRNPGARDEPISSE